MKLKRILALLLIFTMILPNFLMPLKYVALATGENNFELVFTGNDLVFNNDGSVSLKVHREDEEPAEINIKVYNDYNEQIEIQDLTDIYAVYYAENPELQGLKIAGCTIPFSAITGCYLEITSANADLNMIRFFIGNNDYSIDQDERIYLPADVLDSDFQGIDFRQIIDLNAKKRVNFKGNNLSIDENTITMDSPLPYTEGTLSFTVYNYDDSVVTPELYYVEDLETHQLVLSTTDAFAKLDSSAYYGAYMIVTATGNVDLTDVKLHCNDAIMYIDNNGRIDLSDDTDYIEVSSWSLRNINEKKEIFVEGNNLVVSGNTITIDSPIEDNEGRITLAFYNVDDSPAIVSARMDWNEQLQQDVPSNREANAILKGTSYLGSYMIVSGDQDFDMGNIKFRLDGLDTYLAEANKVYFPADANNVNLGNWSILPLIEKKELSVRGNNIEVSNNTITIDSPIEGNEGRITFAFYNADNTAARAERRVDYYDHETEQDVYSETEAVVRFNTTTYEGTYMIVTSTSNPPVDLTNMRIELPGVYPYPTVPASGRIDFPAQADWINLDEYTIRPLYEKKQINIAGDNLVISGNVATFDCPIVGNEGRLTLTFYNADNSPMSLQQYHIWNESLGQDELDPRSGWAKLNATTYAGAYFIVSSTSTPAVDLTDVKFNFNGQDFMLGQDYKITLTAAMDNYWVNIDEHNIMEVNTRKNIQFYNENTVLNSDNTITFDCNIGTSQGRLTIGLYNSDNTMVKLEQDMIWDMQLNELVPSNHVRGKLKTTTYEGAYITVVSDGNVDLTKIRFIFDNTEYAVEDGKVYLPNMQADYVMISSNTIVNSEKVPVTVHATSENANMSELRINNIEFIDRDPANPVLVNTVNRTLNVDLRTMDSLEIMVDYGYVISSLTINNDLLVENGNIAWYQGEIPHSDTYEITVVCAIDESILPNLSWSYGVEEIWGPEAVINHAMVEIVSVTLPDQSATYTGAQLSEILDDPGIGPHFAHEGEATLSFDYDPYTQEIIAGQLSALAGSTITLRITPDYGYQVVNTEVTGGELVPINNRIAEYTIVMPANRIRLTGIIGQVANAVVSKTALVESGTLTIPQTGFTEGSLVLEVNAVNTTTLNQNGFETTAESEGYEIKTYFNLALNQVLYKGSADDVWFGRITEVTNDATISLKLANGIDADDIIIVHNFPNSEEFEVIAIDSYNETTNTITFKTRSFSDFAIATKIEEEPYIPEEYDLWVNGQRFSEEKTIINCGEGTAEYDAEKNVLTLTNATITTPYEYKPYYEAVIYSECPHITIELVGTNTLTTTASYVDGIDAASGCNVIIQGEGTLNIENVYYGTYIGDWEAEGGNLTVKGGTINVTNTEAAGIWANHNITFENCTVNITRNGISYNGIVSNVDGTIKVKNSLVTVENVQSAIHFGNGDASKHHLLISSGTVTLTSTDAYGIFVQPDNDTDSINGSIKIRGGVLDVTSEDGGSNIPEENISMILGWGYDVGETLSDNNHVVIKEVENIELPFPDAEAGRWYIDSVKYVYVNGLMSGYATGDFGPNDKITRGQIVTILYREAGSPDSNYDMDFADVTDSTKYYYNAVRWAAENGIVTGYMSGPDAGKFKPNDNITREQLAVILQRYAKYVGKDYTTKGDLTGFSDYTDVSNYALDGMRWAVGVGIIKGNADGTLKPKGTASRAEAATMIMRFLEELPDSD